MSLVTGDQQRRVSFMEERNPADADGAERVAVVGLSKMEEFCFVRTLLALVSPILEGHLERNLHRRRAIVRIKHSREAGRGEPNQLFRQGDGRRIGYAQHGRVRNPAELCGQGPIECRLSVAMEIDPDRRNAVKIPASFAILQVDALSSFDNQRSLFFPILLLREGMPEVAPVIGLQPARTDVGNGDFLHQWAL